MPDFTDTLKPAQDGNRIITKEREGSNVPVDELSQHLLTRGDFLRRQAKVLKVLKKEPLFRKHKQLNLSRPERYHLGLARAKKLLRLRKEHGWDDEDHKMSEYLCDDVSPFMLQMSMFVTTVREQGDAKQRDYWLPKILDWRAIGAYAQTELGHGSNVKGIELQARWDPKAKEFVLHSPTLTASKWWNGSMGRTGNHAVVLAQLMLPSDGDASQYKSYGPHPFMVQIRDMKTHKPLDGVAVGDIGPKYGYAPMDNGYILFNDFRIPHSAMLSRYSKVDPDTGHYTKPENPAVSLYLDILIVKVYADRLTGRLWLIDSCEGQYCHACKTCTCKSSHSGCQIHDHQVSGIPVFHDLSILLIALGVSSEIEMAMTSSQKCQSWTTQQSRSGSCHYLQQPLPFTTLVRPCTIYTTARARTSRPVTLASSQSFTAAHPG